MDRQDRVADGLARLRIGPSIKKTVADLELKLQGPDTDEIQAVKALFLFHPSERSGIGWRCDLKLKDLVRTASHQQSSDS